MKSLLVYITPNKKFDPESEKLIKVHIDNNYSLGLKAEDLILVTNWDYEYNGVKAATVGLEHFCKVRPRSIKTSVVPALYDLRILERGEIYWNHDFDAYQNWEITEEELGIGGFDCGLTDYGWRLRWCMGSYFFKESAVDLFTRAKDIIFTDVEDEDAFGQLTKGIEDAKRCKRLNITYNFGKNKIEENYLRSDKPVRVLHFHPRRNLLDCFMHGKNKLGIPLMSERLIGVFKHHGIS